MLPTDVGSPSKFEGRLCNFHSLQWLRLEIKWSLTTDQTACSSAPHQFHINRSKSSWSVVFNRKLQLMVSSFNKLTFLSSIFSTVLS